MDIKTAFELPLEGLVKCYTELGDEEKAAEFENVLMNS